MIKLGKFINLVMEEGPGNGVRTIIIKPISGDRIVFEGTMKDLHNLIKLEDHKQREIILKDFDFNLGTGLDTFSMYSMKPVIWNEKDKDLPEYNRSVVIRIY